MGKKLVINPGDKFGKLTIIREVEKRKNERTFLCKCDCGNEKTISLGKLTSGHTKSCGCYRIETILKNHSTHKCSNTKIYRIWGTMKERCLNPNNKKYNYYGGRGITICGEWLEFQCFHDWAISNGYQEGLSIERKDVNGNYEPDNCTWIPKSDQPKNCRRNIILNYNGETKYLQAWANEYNISRTALWYRIKKGWGMEKALTTPTKK